VSHRPPLVLTILDGWGCRAAAHGNAIAAADTPNWHRLLRDYPWTELDASGEAVGLPPGIMGNSEVGHINIGSGRTVPQGIVVIDAQIADGSFRTNPVLTGVLGQVAASGGTLHFLGLLSDGKVHSSQDHLEALIDAAVAAGVPIAIDAFLDGRDVPPRSAEAYISRLEAYLAAHGRAGAIATVGGRYFGMDRDKRWDRIEKAYDALVRGTAAYHAATASAALDAAYARDENDEFVTPTIVGAPRPIRDGDGVIFFNFRPDRARQLTLAFSDPALTNSRSTTSTILSSPP
jgi:2,3-bisphosphoglycerate-independent phosphoglycerate mutase